MLFPTVGVGAEVSFRHYLDFRSNLIITLAASYHFPMQRPAEERQPLRPKPLQLELEEVEFETVFPVFFKYYDDHPMGKATLHNTSDVALEDITLSFYVKRYMDDPKQIAVQGALEPGKKRE